MFDPETLRTFIAVAETGSFSKAAERLCKTTATISYRIKLLEENTGVALFFRTTRSVTLTAAGEHLLSQARDWLSWLESMPSELQQVNDGVETPGEYCHQQPALQPPGRRPVAGVAE
ncbi:transcriptional regulator, LysR family [Escherichia coli B7A]|nr:transcriptional regulator, LysR family [Escherichia coli B7A]